MANEKYEVIRAHSGDKDYAVGDTREANPNDVAHLIGKCLKKKAPAAKNKAAAASLNKGK